MLSGGNTVLNGHGKSEELLVGGTPSLKGLHCWRIENSQLPEF